MATYISDRVAIELMNRAAFTTVACSARGLWLKQLVSVLYVVIAPQCSSVRGMVTEESEHRLARANMGQLDK